MLVIHSPAAQASTSGGRYFVSVAIQSSAPIKFRWENSYTGVIYNEHCYPGEKCGEVAGNSGNGTSEPKAMWTPAGWCTNYAVILQGDRGATQTHRGGTYGSWLLVGGGSLPAGWTYELNTRAYDC